MSSSTSNPCKTVVGVVNRRDGPVKFLKLAEPADATLAVSEVETVTLSWIVQTCKNHSFASCRLYFDAVKGVWTAKPAGWNASIPLRRPLTAYTLRGSASLTLNQGKPRLTINGSGQAAPILVVVLRWSQALKMITTGPLCQPLGHFAIVEAGLDSKWRLAVFWRPIRNPTLSIDGLIWKDDRYISKSSLQQGNERERSSTQTSTAMTLRRSSRSRSASPAAALQLRRPDVTSERLGTIKMGSNGRGNPNASLNLIFAYWSIADGVVGKEELIAIDEDTKYALRLHLSSNSERPATLTYHNRGNTVDLTFWTYDDRSGHERHFLYNFEQGRNNEGRRQYREVLPSYT